MKFAKAVFYRSILRIPFVLVGLCANLCKMFGNEPTKSHRRPDRNMNYEVSIVEDSRSFSENHLMGLAPTTAQHRYIAPRITEHHSLEATECANTCAHATIAALVLGRKLRRLSPRK